MSLFHPMNLVCPNCGAAVTMMAVGSVNADRRPDYRDAILDDSFQDTTCGACGESFRLQPQFNYLDAGRRQWIAAMPADRLRFHTEVAEQVDDLFAESYGPRAPEAARAVGDGLDVRLTFGWPAVREKLLARQEGLDDTVLEMTKLDVLRNTEKAPIAEGVELRLVAAREEHLIFVWLETATEKPLLEVSVPRSAYDAITENGEAWHKIKERLETSAFVDIQKLYMVEEPA